MDTGVSFTHLENGETWELRQVIVTQSHTKHIVYEMIMREENIGNDKGMLEDEKS